MLYIYTHTYLFFSYISIKVNQEHMFIGQSLEHSKRGASNCPLLMGSWTALFSWQWSVTILTQAFESRVFIGARSPTDWSSTRLTSASSPLGGWAEPPDSKPPPHITLLVWLKAPRETEILAPSSPFQGSRDELPGSKGRGQTSSRTRLNPSLHSYQDQIWVMVCHQKQ